MKPVRVLLQTTIPHTTDDWHIGRFSLLARELEGARVGSRRVQVVARDRSSAADDPVLTCIDETDFDEVWIFGVDTGSGITQKETEALVRFRKRRGGLLTARDHQDLGSCLASLPGPGLANYFRSRNQDPVVANRCDDDCFTRGVSWPNYHSGDNGDVQRVEAVQPIHPLLRRPDGTVIGTLPAHPHEGAIGTPPDEPGRVIAMGTSATTGKAFNLIVAFDGAACGRAVAHSSFHHFVDFNWDTRLGAPSFVTDPTGTAIRDAPHLLDDVKIYARNLVTWLVDPHALGCPDSKVGA
jgi:hypothetical protein